jgi:hypothetical protein
VGAHDRCAVLGDAQRLPRPSMRVDTLLHLDQTCAGMDDRTRGVREALSADTS